MKSIFLIITCALCTLIGAKFADAMPGRLELKSTPGNIIMPVQETESRSLGALRGAADREANAASKQQSQQIGIYQTAQNWIRKKQAEVTRQLSTYISKLEQTSDNSIAVALVLASLIYGLVHAAGPGHGKVIVSSYVLIILLGLYLLYKSLSPLVLAPKVAAVGHASHDHHHDHTCNHKHMPDATELEGNWSLAKVASLTLSVGLRPCTGAIFVLVFAFVKGLFWAGVLSVYAMALGTAITISAVTVAAVLGRDAALFSLKDRSSAARFAFNALAIGASLVIILFGLLLLTSSFEPARPF